ncbi:MAG: FtsQ-type POTRA domain-containing protein [Acidobacteriota bacterium]|nr:FtsQ-type POTRA domain-containing protein [Acidobacteriota bacterium]
MQALATGTDKRFRRARVKPARKRSLALKQAWLAARSAVVCALLIYGGYRGVALVADAQTLQIGHLVVRGHERLSAGEVLALVDGLRGQNILTVRLDQWRQRLLASPWVDRATIRRVLPSTVEITVHERRPMGIGRIGTALYLIDGQGVIVDEYGPAYADVDLPIIDGLGTSPQEGGSLVDPLRAEFAGRVIAALAVRPEIARRVSQIDVADLHDAVVILDGDTALLRIGDTDFVARLQQYLDLAPALHERMAAIDYVDLRFDERLYVRPVKAPAKKMTVED